MPSDVICVGPTLTRTQTRSLTLILTLILILTLSLSHLENAPLSLQATQALRDMFDGKMFKTTLDLPLKVKLEQTMSLA
jgi:hypothetical protein